MTDQEQGWNVMDTGVVGNQEGLAVQAQGGFHKSQRSIKTSRETGNLEKVFQSLRSPKE